jgi:hypothetical protein
MKVLSTFKMAVSFKKIDHFFSCEDVAGQLLVAHELHALDCGNVRQPGGG